MDGRSGLTRAMSMSALILIVLVTADELNDPPTHKKWTAGKFWAGPLSLVVTTADTSPSRMT